MKIFHTADWHLGKIVQSVHMTEDQRFVLKQFVEDVRKEQPDVVIIAGDIYDRAVPPTEAVALLNGVLEEIVLSLEIPVFIIAGNHDSPGRLHFGSKMMERNGLHIVGKFEKDRKPAILQDEYGEVHFHFVPFCDPSVVRVQFEDDDIRSHDDAMKKITTHIHEMKDPKARHVFIGHAFVTPRGEARENTSDSEVALSVGGAEHVSHEYFQGFSYAAFGHLHREHQVGENHIRYSGSLLKYSISEEHHEKGYLIVELTDDDVSVEKRKLIPRRDMRTVTASLEEILAMERKEDYVFVELTDRAPILSPMEKVRSIFPNAMHVMRKYIPELTDEKKQVRKARSQMNDLELFEAFYKEVTGQNPEDEVIDLFKRAIDEQAKAERDE